jgi:hypothetical protein
MEEAKLRAELNAERALLGTAPPTPAAPAPAAQEAKL